MKRNNVLWIVKLALLLTIGISLSNLVIAALSMEDKNLMSPDLNSTKLKGISDSVSAKTLSYLKENNIADTKNIKELKSFKESKDEAFVFYEQKYKGLTVYDSQVGVIIRHGEVVQIKKRTYENLNVSTTPELSEETAKSIVLIDSGIESENAELLIYPVKAGKLAWKIDTALKGDEKYRYFVDANTGEILERETLVRHGSVKGQVTGMIFPHNSTGPQKLKNFSNLNVSVRQSNAIVKTTLTNKTGQYNITGITGEFLIYSNFSGPYARINNNDESEKNHSFRINTTGTHNWNWNQSDTSTSDVESNAFYHINIVHDFFTKGAPFNINSMNFQLPVNVRNGTDSFCNAFYTTGNSPSLTMGQGCNLDLSADVYYHEYTHGVVDKTYLNLPYRNMTGALNEALADYFAAVITNDSRIAEKPHFTPFLRNVNNSLRFPENYTVTAADLGNVHDNSRVLSGALWDVRKNIGPKYADNYTMKAMKMQASSFTQFLEDFLILDDNNSNLNDGTPRKTGICNGFSRHGIQSTYCNSSLDGFTIKNMTRPFFNASISGQNVSAAESNASTQGMADDDITSAISIGFQFPYYHRNYSKVYIGSNGYITISQLTSVGVFSYCSLPDVYKPNGTIAAFCDDFDPSSSGGGDVYYWRDNSSSPKKLVVEWHKVKLFGTSSVATFETVLYENGTIVMNYLSMTNNVFSGAVGTENPRGTIATVYFNSSDIDIKDPFALTFIPFNKRPNTTAFLPNKSFTIAKNSTVVFNHTTRDQDGDSLTYQWLINGTLKKTTANYSFKFNSSAIGTYNVTLKISDIYQLQKTHQWNITIANTVPTASNINITPSNANTTSRLNCSYVYSDFNNDSQSGTRIRWFTNGKINNTHVNRTLINASFTKHHQLWRCEVTPKDGFNFGNKYNSTPLNITNLAARISAVNISKSTVFKNTKNITCNKTASDSDNDTISFFYRWHRNNVKLTNTTKFLTNRSYNKTQNISCEVTAFDSFINSTRVNSTKVTVQNSAPSVPTFLNTSRGVFGGTKKKNVTIICNGSSDPDSDIVRVNLQRKSGSSWLTLASNVSASHNLSLTGIASGINITIRCNATDQRKSSAFFNITTNLTIDNSAPSLFISISNNSFLNKNNINLTINSSDSRFSKCVFTNITGTANISTKCKNASFINLANGIYNFTFRVNDTLGNVNQSKRFFTIDKAFPVLNKSTISESVTTSTSLITFKINENANATIKYGTSLSLGSSTSNSSFVRNQSVSISSLSASTKYFYNISYCDKANNCNITSDDFTTSAAPSSGSSGGSSGGGGGGGGSSGGGGGGGTVNTDKITRTFSGLSSGDTATMKLFNDNIPAKKISIELKNEKQIFSLVVEKLEDKPSSIHSTPSEKIFKYFEITKQNINPEDISSATIEFEIRDTWLPFNKVEKEDVRLFRWNGQWDELPTQYKEARNKSLVFEAVTPGFSTFAIGSKPKVISSNSLEKTKVNTSQTNLVNAENNQSIKSLELTEQSNNISEKPENSSTEKIDKSKISSKIIIFAVIMLGIILGILLIIKKKIIKKDLESASENFEKTLENLNNDSGEVMSKKKISGFTKKLK